MNERPGFDSLRLDGSENVHGFAFGILFLVGRFGVKDVSFDFFVGWGCVGVVLLQ